MKNATDITIILDRSGSMHSIKEDTVGAVNEFISEQKGVAGECRLTLVQFDSTDPYEKIRDNCPIGECTLLGEGEYSPRHYTPLHDAIGIGIKDTGERLSRIPEDDKPDKVIFVIVTDGFENRSQEFTRNQIKDLITEQTEQWKWHFVYLGANQDAVLVGGEMGTQSNTSATYAATGTGMKSAIRATSRNVASLRAGVASNLNYSSKQRKEMADNT